MRRLAVFAGALGAIAGGVFAYKVLRYVPSERYQHKVFEKLATSDLVRREQALLISAREDGIVFYHPLTTYVGDPHARGLDVVGQDESAHEVSYETLEDRYSEKIGPVPRQPSTPTEIRSIFWKPDLTVDFFEM